MIDYSIIIPHKNTPDLLQRCLDSIPQRDDLQIIIVDDNSDSSITDPEIFPGIGRSNTEIIFTKEGKGAGYARNVGLKNAKGKWILFADADDFFCQDIIKAIESYKSSSLNLIYFKTICRDSTNTKKIGYRQKLCDQYNKSQEDFNVNHTDFRKTILSFGTPWGKLIQRKFLEENDILFEEVPYSNDIGWVTQVAIHCTEDSFAVSNHILYCLTDRDTSLYHTNNYKALACRFSVFLRQASLLYAHGYKDYISFHVPFYVKKARLLEFSKFFAFLHLIIKENKKIPPVYVIEKKLNLRKPYLYLLVQIIEQMFSIPPRP